MSSNELLYKEETYKIIGACFEVYNEKGSGFLEAVYQECLGIEFDIQGIPYVEQPKQMLEYNGRGLKQTYQPDFICFDKIIIQIKAVKHLTEEHRAQIINYLKSTGKCIGLLINFGQHPNLKHERFINQKIRVICVIRS